MEFFRQEYWSGLLFPSPGDLCDPGIEPRSPALQADALPSEPPGKLLTWITLGNYTRSTIYHRIWNSILPPPLMLHLRTLKIFTLSFDCTQAKTTTQTGSSKFFQNSVICKWSRPLFSFFIFPFISSLEWVCTRKRKGNGNQFQVW